MRKIPFTNQGYDNLTIELDNALAKRPDAVKTLTRARDMGDLSENGLYKAAKMELSDLDRQIRQLKSLLKSANVVEPIGNKTVQIGHKITVRNFDMLREFLIVGEYEANPKENKISNKSPIGYGLMGKKVGDNVSVKTPSGEIIYTIEVIATA